MKLRMKLTKAVCDDLVGRGLPDGRSELFYWDNELKGFGLRLRRLRDGTVRASFTLQYRFGGRKPRKSWDSIVGVAKAREKAEQLRAKLKLGDDPKQKEATGTLKATVAAYLEAMQDDWRPRTAIEAKRYLGADKRYFGSLLPLPIDTITLRDVAARILVIKRECGNATAGRARSALNSCFVWAMRMGLASANPCIGSVNPKTSPGDRVLTPDEIRAIWHACGDDDHGRIVRLLFLTGCRRQEIGGMAWSEFSDLDGLAPTWTLPKARSKNGKAHALPLMLMALAIITHGRPRFLVRIAWPTWLRGLEPLQGIARSTQRRHRSLDHSRHPAQRCHPHGGHRRRTARRRRNLESPIRAQERHQRHLQQKQIPS
jgi:integrase